MRTIFIAHMYMYVHVNAIDMTGSALQRSRLSASRVCCETAEMKNVYGSKSRKPRPSHNKMQSSPRDACIRFLNRHRNGDKIPFWVFGCTKHRSQIKRKNFFCTRAIMNLHCLQCSGPQSLHNILVCELQTAFRVLFAYNRVSIRNWSLLLNAQSECLPQRAARKGSLAATSCSFLLHGFRISCRARQPSAGVPKYVARSAKLALRCAQSGVRRSHRRRGL